MSSSLREKANKAIKNRAFSAGLATSCSPFMAALCRKNELKMIFGNKSDFAIESMIEPHLVVPSIAWGRLCIWIDGHSIGDFDDPHCGLYSSYKGFQETCSQLHELWKEEFKGLNDNELWNLLDGLLYSYHGNEEIEDSRSLSEMNSDWKKYGKYNFLTNWGEMFDNDGKSFIFLQPSGKIKVINYDYERNLVNSYECSEFSFRLATKKFITWYEEQMKLLNSDNA